MTNEPAGGLERQAQVMRAVRQAGNGWAEAMRSHKLAPPDLSFSNRLRALAEAAAREQVAWEHAHAAGLLWRPVPGAEHAEPPYELRPGTGRRGPAELWARFDAAVQMLNRAITGSDAANVADAFGEISEAATALADVIARDDATALADMIARGDTGRDAGTGRQAVAGEGSQAPADTAPPRERGAA